MKATRAGVLSAALLASVVGAVGLLFACGGGSGGSAAGPALTPVEGVVPAPTPPASGPAGGTGDTGTASPVPTPSPTTTGGVAFPLRVEAGKRHLVDSAGQPFLINGDSPWSLIVQLTREEAEQYLEDRRVKGINTILVNLIEHAFARNPPRNANGDAPFTTPGDFGTPNERYFAHADFVIAKAAEKGILVLLTPAYLGSGGGSQGWFQEMSANGTVKLRAYGQFLGNRYRTFSNILWVDGGDFNTPDRALVRAVAEGILSADGKPHTYHAARGTGALQFWGTGEPWLTVNNIYTDASTVVGAAFTEYARSTTPFFLIEALYENEGASDHTVRLQAYQALLSGAAGHVMGNNPVWMFGSGWQSALNSNGARSMKPLSTLFGSRAWWTLQPDTGNTLLVGGVSTAGDRAVAARAADGSFAMAYTPSSRSLTFDMSKLRGPNVRAQWIDPLSGAVTTAAGSPFPASGTRALQSPGGNSSGHGDWVLVLESAN